MYIMPNFSEEVSLPPAVGGNEMVHAALISGDVLYSIESPIGDFANIPWSLNKYNVSGKTLSLVTQRPTFPWMYGIAVAGGDVCYTVTGQQAKVKHGVYRNDDIVVAGVCGNGVCFLEDGSAIVTHYGLSGKQPLGKPGALIFIPANLLS